jgi:hypothetical protein
MCLFLSMVVWQPFRYCWRYIIARVSEMHVAYHTNGQVWYIYILGTNNINISSYILSYLCSYVSHSLYRVFIEHLKAKSVLKAKRVQRALDFRRHLILPIKQYFLCIILLFNI